MILAIFNEQMNSDLYFTYFNLNIHYGTLWNYNLNMKFVVAALLALIATPASSLLCDQGAVPTQNNVCIVPDYIEGCWQYAS